MCVGVCVHVCLHTYGYIRATEHMWKDRGNLWDSVPCFHYVALALKMGVRSPVFTGTLLPAQPFRQPSNYSTFSFLFGTKSQDMPQNSWCSCLSFSRSIDKGVHHHILLPFAFQIKKNQISEDANDYPGSYLLWFCSGSLEIVLTMLGGPYEFQKLLRFFHYTEVRMLA